MSYEYDFLIYIGRFQTPHLGHQHIIDQALEKSQKVIILCGSSNRPRSNQNPWTFEERKDMLSQAYPNHTDRLIILPLDDFDYNDDAWLGNAQSMIQNVIDSTHAKIGVIGFEKDKSSYYLHMFPQYDKVLLEEQWGTISATQIREMYFQRAPYIPDHLLSPAIIEYLKKFMLTDEFRYVLNEFEGLKKHHNKWPPNMPYPVQTVTVDSVVTQGGHILLVERNEVPGVGLLALPGGHVDTKKVIALIMQSQS